jgi:hypothetical protein
MPSEESGFLAACVLVARRHLPSLRSADALNRLRDRPVFGLVIEILRKYRIVDPKLIADQEPLTERKLDEATRKLLNDVLDACWPHIRGHIPAESVPVSRRTR